jgi:uncharacterized membrane protein YphA (DoxX/SURF4 family)
VVAGTAAGQLRLTCTAPTIPENLMSTLTDLSPPAPTRLQGTAWPWIATVVRVGLGGVAFAAGIPKIVDLPASVRAVRAYELLPEGLAVLAGNVLPLVEIILGVLLVLGLFTRVSAGAFGLLLLAFAVGIASAWARGLSIDCGCFGGGGSVDPEDTAYLTDLLRDAALIALAAVLVWRPRTRLSLDSALDLSL